MAGKKQTIKSKDSKKLSSEKRNLTNGRIYVTATFNNTLVTLTDLSGNTLTWSTSGAAGFKGARRSTPFAAISATEHVAQKAKEMGISTVELYIKGPGPGRDASIRALRSAGLNITMIADVTPVPYNGVRKKKPRRV